MGNQRWSDVIIILLFLSLPHLILLHFLVSKQSNVNLPNVNCLSFHLFPHINIFILFYL